MAKIKFLTDSAADIPDSLLKEYDIEMIPFPIHTEEEDLLDRVTLSPDEFYDLLEEEDTVPTHAQITPFQFGEIFYKAWKDGYSHVIYTSINSRGSATYQNAVQAAHSFLYEYPSAKDKLDIHIIDSHSYSLAYGFPVVEGAKMGKKGVAPKEIIAFIEDWVKHSKILFIPYSLKFAKKSGRVSATTAFMGEALGLRPIITFKNGESKILGKVRGEKNVVSALIEMCQEDRQVGAPYCIMRTTMENYEEELIDECTEEFGEAPSMSEYVGGVISINAGTKVIGIAYRKEDPENPMDEWKWDYSKVKAPELKKGYIR